MTALFPDAAPSRITVRLKNGTVVQNETRYPKGHHGAPMTGNEVEDKFRGLFGTYRGAAQANTMIELIAQLDTRDDIGEIFTAFA
jgi:2-methylcitrate dehydratase PrpD